MRKIHSFFLKNRKWLDTFGLCVIATAILVQFSIFAGMIAQHADHRSIIATIDNDSAAAIENSLKTNLISDNGYRAYGPVYYRITSVIRYIVGDSNFDVDRSPLQNRERMAYIQLMVVSLLALYVFAFFISAILTDRLFYQLLGTFIFVSLIFKNDVRTNLIFMAKPDHLSALLIAFALFVSFKWYRQRTEQKLRWMAVAWGVAAATKLNVLLLAPTLLVLFLPFRWKRDQNTLKTFLKWSLGSYFVIGFPQNFDIGGTFEYLASQQRNITLGNWEFTKVLLDLFARELKYTVAGAIFFALLVPLRAERANLSAKQIGLFTLALSLSTLYLLTRKILPPYEWYPFPFLSCWLMLVALALHWASFRFRIEEKLRGFKNNIYFPLFCLVLVPLIINPIPDNWGKQAKLMQQCRPEARAVQSMLDEAATLGRKIIVDPYLPYNPSFHDKEIRMYWDMTPELLKTADLVALKGDYYLDYIPRSEGGREFQVGHVKNIEQTRDFYRLFYNKTETKDPFGQNWVRTHKDHCRFEIWRKK